MLARIAKLYAEKKHFWPKTSYAAIFAQGLKTDRERELRALGADAHRFLLDPTPEAVAGASHDVLAAAHVMAKRADRDLDLLAVAAGLLGVEKALSVAVRSTY